MSRLLDTEGWARRDAFDYFRAFDQPFFNVCTRVDVSRLKAALAGRAGLSLACYYIALRLANEQEPFRLRLEGGRVRVHDIVHGSTTVLHDDGESFGFADLSYVGDFTRFAADARASIEAARHAQAAFEPKPEDLARIHFTSLPWLHFTSFSHASRSGRGDSVPKIAFGRADAEGERLWMPLSVAVHHGLMDGVHVGRFVQAFEQVLIDPLPWINPAAAAGPGTPTTA